MVDEKTNFLIHTYGTGACPDQGSRLWFKARESILTASTIASLIGQSRFKTKTQCIIDKVLGCNFAGNEATHYGRMFEQAAINIHSLLTRSNIESLGLVTHSNYKFLGASPDGIITNRKKIGTLIEIKCPLYREINNTVPDIYWHQMQLQLECCDLDYCDFVQCKFSVINRDEFLLEEEKQKGCLIEWVPKNTESNLSNEIFTHACLTYTKKQLNEWIAAQVSSSLMKEDISFRPNRVIYWVCDIYKCVTVKRDTSWIKNNIKTLMNCWDTIVLLRDKENKKLLQKMISICRYDPDYENKIGTFIGILKDNGRDKARRLVKEQSSF